MPDRLLPRLLSALPDAVTAAFFMILWISPMRFGSHGVRNGMLIMLVEFILIRASGFLGSTAFAAGLSGRSKIRALAAFDLFYLLFIAAWSWAFPE